MPGKGRTALWSLLWCPTGWTELECQSLPSDRSFTNRFRGSEAPPLQKHSRASTLAHSYWGEEKTEGSPIKCWVGHPDQGSWEEQRRKGSPSGVWIHRLHEGDNNRVLTPGPMYSFPVFIVCCTLNTGPTGSAWSQRSRIWVQKWQFLIWQAVKHPRKQTLVLWKWVDAAVCV